jgi:hypothetical protein
LDVASGTCVKTLKGHLEIDPYLISTYKLDDERIKKLHSHWDINRICFSHDDRYLICVNGGKINILEIEKSICIRSLGNGGHTMYGVDDIALAPDNQALFSTQWFFIHKQMSGQIFRHNPLEKWKMLYKSCYTFILSRPLHAAESHKIIQAVRDNISNAQELIRRENFAEAYKLLQTTRALHRVVSVILRYWNCYTFVVGKVGD